MCMPKHFNTHTAAFQPIQCSVVNIYNNIKILNTHEYFT